MSNHPARFARYNEGEERVHVGDTAGCNYLRGCRVVSGRRQLIRTGFRRQHAGAVRGQTGIREGAKVALAEINPETGRAAERQARDAGSDAINGLEFLLLLIL